MRYYRVFSSIPDLYLLDTRSTTASVVTDKYVSKHHQMSPGAEGERVGTKLNCWLTRSLKRLELAFLLLCD